MTTIQYPMSFVYDPESRVHVDYGPQDPSSPTSWGPQRYARFIGELGERCGAPVRFIVGSLRDALPADGFLLLDAVNYSEDLAEACPDLDERAALMSRIVLIDVSPNHLLEDVLEKSSYAAAVDSHSFLGWAIDRRGELGARGVFGLRDIGLAVGATGIGFYESERYCYLESKVHHGLPHLLADYLAALARQRMDA